MSGKPEEKKGREKILSITAKDCIKQTFRGSGAGGQHRNKTDSCVRWIHPPSGARGQACEDRSQLQNSRKAWRRMAESDEMRLWIRMQVGGLALAEEAVKKAMNPRNLKIEGKNEKGQWDVDAMQEAEGVDR